MDSLKRLFAKLFDNQKAALPDIPFVHEAIDLKSYPVSDMLHWITTDAYHLLIEVVATGYRDRLITGKSVSKSVAILDSSHSNGWLLQCSNLPYNHLDYQHFAYYLHTQVKKEGYTVNLAEKRSQRRGDAIESITKYYLKPSLRNLISSETKHGKPVAKQLFGNITIEYVLIDDQPSTFKFMANAYADSKYAEPYDFGDLIDKILDS